MQKRLLVSVSCVLLGACGASAGDRAPTSQSDARDVAGADAPRVFVEAMIVDAPDDARAGHAFESFAAASETPDVTVLAAPNVLTGDRAPAQMFIDAQPPTDATTGGALYWRVAPDVLDHDDVHLELDLVTKAMQPPMHASISAHVGQLVVVGTSLATRPGRAVVVLLRAHVVRSQDDLRAIFEQKRREEVGADAG